MAVQESYDIIAFRSRQHALYFSQILKEAGVAAQIMDTPREAAMGCGLSLRFSPYMTPRVRQIYLRYQIPVVGFYHINREGTRNRLTRIPFDM